MLSPTQVLTFDQIPNPQTTQEAIEELAQDLDFLAKLRMYFALHPDIEKARMPDLKRACGYSQPTFNRIYRGEMVSGSVWRSVLNILRGKMGRYVNQFDKQKIDKDFFAAKLKDGGKYPAIEKFRMKPAKRARAKKAE